MKRITLLKFLNPILGLLLLNQICTAIFKDALSPGAFEIMHEAAGVVLAVVALLHVILNWNWVKTNYFTHAPKPRP